MGGEMQQESDWKFQPFAYFYIPFMRLEREQACIVEECEFTEIDFPVHIVQIHPDVAESLR